MYSTSEPTKFTVVRVLLVITNSIVWYCKALYGIGWQSVCAPVLLVIPAWMEAIGTCARTQSTLCCCASLYSWALHLGKMRWSKLSSMFFINSPCRLLKYNGWSGQSMQTINVKRWRSYMLSGSLTLIHVNRGTWWNILAPENQIHSVRHPIHKNWQKKKGAILWPSVAPFKVQIGPFCSFPQRTNISSKGWHTTLAHWHTWLNLATF